jgi:8-oxo-dGTP diphosphatase
MPQKNCIAGKDYPGVSVVYFCHDGKGNIVLAKRSKNARDEHGRWDIGAGGLDLGRTVEETLRKEIKEEYCTDVIDFEFLGFRDVHRLHDGVKTHWIALDFKVLIDPKKVKNGEPHKLDEVGFFKLNKLPKPVHSQLPTFLRKYLLQSLL